MSSEGVTYTVKELIAMLEEKLVEQMGTIVSSLDKINEKLDGKASIRSVRDLEDRFETFREKVEARIGGLENTRAGGLAIGKVGMWLIGTVGATIFLACVTLIIAVAEGRHP